MSESEADYETAYTAGEEFIEPEDETLVEEPRQLTEKEVRERLSPQQRQELDEFNRLNNENNKLMKLIGSYGGDNLSFAPTERFTMFMEMMRSMIADEDWNAFEMRWAKHLNTRLRGINVEIMELVKDKQARDARVKILGPSGRPLKS